MCGIIAYIGNKECKNILIEGLKRLEYRGYDSAGIGILYTGKGGTKGGVNTDNEIYHIAVVKNAGKIRALENELRSVEVDGFCGIGHTRWATHGEPTKVNAHPHLDCSSKIAVVHNGIIENYAEIREELRAKGHKFVSQTDTEVLPHLLEEYYNGDLLIAMQKLMKRIKGSGAIVAISTYNPDEIIGARIASPLVIGVSRNGNFLASDMPAALEHTRNFIVINDYETARVTRSGVEIFDHEGKIIDREPFKVSWSIASAEKAGYEDFMLKEIFEQPYGIKETMRGRVVNGKLNFNELGLSEKQIRDLKRVQIIACGTSYHAALIGRQLIERWAKIPVEVDVSSEYRYRDPIVEDNCLFIAITQSGETIDTLAAIREAKAKGARIVSITNVVGSTVARESDSVIYTHAGPEIGVCATKTFTAQVIVMYLMALYFGMIRGYISGDGYKSIVQELEFVPNKVQNILNRADEIKSIADRTYKYTCFLFLGRLYGLPVALEGALKLKEISYIHAEGYAAGEMKHGPIALTDRQTVVVAITPKDSVYEKMLSNVQEVKARKATVFTLATEGDTSIQKYADYVFYLPKTLEELYGILAIIPLQLYAYYIAKNLGRNVDQPRNLAKSVTVE
ncbi:MAG: glutamine--fructose-6-phosphate transaminase (isomerizing) [Actinobacteria bacterium]|nr:glutamine--fructose-6-phosphate transaminase (isomerizing) [Actinomycetota bacterium]